MTSVLGFDGFDLSFFAQAQPPGGGSIAGVPLIPVLMMIAAVAIIVLVLRGIAGVYQKVPPEQALVIYGAGDTRVVSGGSAFVWPFVNQSYVMDLTINQVEVELDQVPNKDKVPVNVRAVATYKISNKQELLIKAAQNFGSADKPSGPKGEDTKELKVKHILESHLRSVISKLTLDSLLSERDQFNQQIQNDSEPELEELGLELKSFNILHVSDNNGVIEALGKKETAKVLADAEIEQAAQTRRKTIETTTAKREAETTAAENDRAIAEAKQNKEKKTLSYEAEVSRQRATTAQAEPLAAAEARKGVVAAEVAVEQSRAEAEITLQDAVRRRNQAKVEASTIVEAEAEKRRQLLVAEGEAAAKVKSAEGTRQAAELEGEGMAKRSLAIGTAEAEVTEKKGLAQAQVTQETGFAEARVRRERGLADAEVVKQTGLAEAEGSKAKLLSTAEGEGAMLSAQAEGRRKMVEAYRDLDEDQRRMLFVTMMLERLPAVITAAGEAGREVMRPIADSITAAVGQIGSITVFDSAANHGDGSLQRVVNMGPETMFKIFAQLKALGLLEVAEGLAGKLGLDLSQFKLDGEAAANGHGSPKPAEGITVEAKGN